MRTLQRNVRLSLRVQRYELFFTCQVFFKLFLKKLAFFYKSIIFAEIFVHFPYYNVPPMRDESQPTWVAFSILAPRCRVVFPIAIERWCFSVNALQMLCVVIVGYAEAYSPFILHSLAEVRVARLEQSVKLVSLPQHIERTRDNEYVIAFLEALVVKSVFLCHTSILFISQCYL